MNKLELLSLHSKITECQGIIKDRNETVTELRNEIEVLKSKLEKAKTALEFYANKSNWYPNERFKESGRIDDNDLEHFPGNQTSDLIGGKIARKALEGLE
ncbi:MAG: hypothetical protein ACXVCP_00305 [Bdellovibrio sp.]